MDSTDDDFGELYIDVKAQAHTAFAGDLGSAKPYEESDCAMISEKKRSFEGTVKLDSQGEKKKLGVVTLNRTEANEESDCSDSDDDLNIVLKGEDDSNSLPVASTSFTNNGGYASAYSACIDPSLAMLHCGYGSSHPWSRSDILEKKPWRDPGRDVSDFFNFGLNEQSWKDYCKPLGRAIEVESGTIERKPSADSRPPRNSDPDVVIQIPVMDDVEEIPVEARSLSITSNEAARSEHGIVKDEAFVNAGSFSGEQSSPTENSCSREVTPCDKEMVDEDKEENFRDSDEADKSSLESESSLGDRIRLSPTSSFSLSRNEESEDYDTESLKDSATDDQREVSTPPRQARHEEHEAISIKRKEKNGPEHSRHRRSHEDSSKRHCGRADYAVHKHRSIKDASHTPDAYLGKRVRSRHGHFYDDSTKNWQNGPYLTSERDETEGKDFLHSNREKRHVRSYSSADHVRPREHRFSLHKNKESSQGRCFDHSNAYKHEARLKEYTSHSSFNVNRRNYQSSSKEEDDQYGMHHCGNKYGYERGSVLAYESNRERNRYDQLREPYYKDTIPLNDIDYRYQLNYSPSHVNPRQSHENDLHSRRRGDDEYYRHRYEDEIHQAELAYREMHSFAAVRRREYQRHERNEEFLDVDRRHQYTPDWHLDRFVSEKDDYKHRNRDAWPEPSLSLRDYWCTKESRGDSWRDDTREFRNEAYDNHNQLYKASLRDGWTQNLVHNDHLSIRDRLTYEDDWVRERYPFADDIECSMREVTYPEHPLYTDEMLVRDIRVPLHNRLSIKQRSGYFKSHIHEIDERHHSSKKLRRDVNTFIKCQDPIESVELTGTQRKLLNQSKRRSFNGRDTIEQSDGQKSKKIALQIEDLVDKEEGEIIEETMNMRGMEIDNGRIQESLKKMEKRRERFKQTKPIETTVESQIEPRAKTDVTNQQRPVRKRRWCAS